MDNKVFQRFISIFLYTIPLKAAFPFGYYLFTQFSFLKLFAYITIPIALIENSLPFGGLLLFLIVFAGFVKNPKVPYFVRFNACQALLLDIALIIFYYLFRIFPITQFSPILFIVILSVFIFSSIQCLYGVEPEIPLISKSARMQIF